MFGSPVLSRLRARDFSLVRRALIFVIVLSEIFQGPVTFAQAPRLYLSKGYLIYEGPLEAGGANGRYHVDASYDDHTGGLWDPETKEWHELEGSYAKEYVLHYFRRHLNMPDLIASTKSDWNELLSRYGYEGQAADYVETKKYDKPDFIYIYPPSGTNAFGRNYGSLKEIDAAVRALNGLFLSMDLKSNQGVPVARYDRDKALIRVDTRNLNARQVALLLSDNPYDCSHHHGEYSGTEKEPLQYVFPFVRFEQKYYEFFGLDPKKPTVAELEKKFGFNLQQALAGKRKNNPLSIRFLLSKSKVTKSSRTLEWQPQLDSIPWSKIHWSGKSYTRDTYRELLESNPTEARRVLLSDILRRENFADLRFLHSTFDFNEFSGTGRDNDLRNVTKLPIDFHEDGGMGFIELPSGYQFAFIFDAEGNLLKEVPGRVANYRPALWHYRKGSLSDRGEAVPFYHLPGRATIALEESSTVSILNCRTCHDSGNYFASFGKGQKPSYLDMDALLEDGNFNGQLTDDRERNLKAADLAIARLIYGSDPLKYQYYVHHVSDENYLEALRSANAFIANPTASKRGRTVPAPTWSDMVLANKLPLTRKDLAILLKLNEKDVEDALASRSQNGIEVKNLLGPDPSGKFELFERRNLEHEVKRGGEYEERRESNFCALKRLIPLAAAEERNRLANNTANSPERGSSDSAAPVHSDKVKTASLLWETDYRGLHYSLGVCAQCHKNGDDRLSAKSYGWDFEDGQEWIKRLFSSGKATGKETRELLQEVQERLALNKGERMPPTGREGAMDEAHRARLKEFLHRLQNLYDAKGETAGESPSKTGPPARNVASVSHGGPSAGASRGARPPAESIASALSGAGFQDFKSSHSCTRCHHPEATGKRKFPFDPEDVAAWKGAIAQEAALGSKERPFLAKLTKVEKRLRLKTGSPPESNPDVMPPDYAHKEQKTFTDEQRKRLQSYLLEICKRYAPEGTWCLDPDPWKALGN